MKILIIGRKSRISQFLNQYLDKNFLISVKDYSAIINKNQNYFERYDYIINCTSNKKYINLKYNPSFDFDYSIAKKIVKTKTCYVFLSSRKIYKSKENCKEKDKPHPSCNYSKNKLMTENKLKKIINKKLLILRISNVIGLKKKESKKKLHKTFIDIFFDNIKKGYILNNQKIFKDFISSKKLGQLISKLIKLNATGTYNLSIGKKIYLNQIVKWLNFYNPRKTKIINSKKFNYNNDCFYLNNKKVTKKTKIKILISDLKKDCKKISKEYFLIKKPY